MTLKGKGFALFSLAAIAALSLFALACGDDDDGDDGDAAPTATREASSPAPQATATTETSSSPAAGNDVTTAMIEGPDGPQGPFLVNADGLTLYIFDDDVAGSGTSACTGGCASAWPAATVASASATPAASEDVTGELGTITREDGSLQITYKGKPLYRFANDAAPGDANGSTVPKWTIAAP